MHRRSTLKERVALGPVGGMWVIKGVQLPTEALALAEEQLLGRNVVEVQYVIDIHRL